MDLFVMAYVGRSRFVKTSWLIRLSQVLVRGSSIHYFTFFIFRVNGDPYDLSGE